MKKILILVFLSIFFACDEDKNEMESYHSLLISNKENYNESSNIELKLINDETYSVHTNGNCNNKIQIGIDRHFENNWYNLTDIGDIKMKCGLPFIEIDSTKKIIFTGDELFQIVSNRSSDLELPIVMDLVELRLYIKAKNGDKIQSNRFGFSM